ncbi:hypothetical protein [Aquabacterium sp. CECT 9606]|uniref:hypothetical protein n=1 Tax=Aquabacterium sp. CECT 9606 TaxID=2845822 RepID=UPI001E640052|nr:hypothetical protein [Aquabacterium sp. CECT 9606]CAH0354051.1 hypothetical protein AQB9606_03450 [Aquabacterium sp. CECT 9606]
MRFQREFFAIAFSLALASPAWSDIGYTVQIVGGSGLAINAGGLNNLGQAVGEVSRQSTGDFIAVKFGPSGRDYIGPNNDWINSFAGDINDQGEIVGSQGAYLWTQQAYVWRNGQTQALPVVISSSEPVRNVQSVANAINNAGDIAGWYSTDGGKTNNAVVWHHDGSFADISALTNGAHGTAAYDINERGDVVGDTTVDQQSFVLSGTQVTLLSGRAMALNNLGSAIGYSRVGWDARATVWDQQGQATLLDQRETGNSSIALGINDAGLAVGIADGYQPETGRAMLWRDGEAIDLNSLIDPSLRLQLGSAVAINEQGQILAQTRYRQVVVLTPVPELSSVWMMGIGGLALAGLAWRRRQS